MIFPTLEINKLFGRDAGEEEDSEFLRDVFVESSAYKAAISNDAVTVIASRKGIGKSALLKRVYIHTEEEELPAVRITPTDLAPTQPLEDYNLLVRHYRQSIAHHCLGALANRLNIAISAEAQAIIQTAEQEGFRNPNILSRIARTFQSIAKADLSKSDGKVKPEILLQKLENNSPLFVIIDNLDQGWQPRETRKISALMTAIREIISPESGKERFRFRLAMRSDVWLHLELTDEQFDKFRDDIHRLRWENKELHQILAKRIRRAIQNTNPEWLEEYDTSDTKLIHSIFQPNYSWSGEDKPIESVLTKLTRKSPRDLLQLAKGAARRAREHKHDRILQEDVRSEYEHSFSKERVHDIYKEYKSEFPDIETLIGVFCEKRERWVFSLDEMEHKIREGQRRCFAKNKKGFFIFDKPANTRECLEFLFRCDFVSARQLTGPNDYHHLEFQGAPELFSASIADTGYDWEIHPAYRPYLERLGVSQDQQQRQQQRQQSSNRPPFNTGSRKKISPKQ